MNARCPLFKNDEAFQRQQSPSRRLGPLSTGLGNCTSHMPLGGCPASFQTSPSATCHPDPPSYPSISSITEADSDPWVPCQHAPFLSPSPDTSCLQSLSATCTLLSAARLARRRGPVLPLWMSLGKLPIALVEGRKQAHRIVSYPVHSASSSILGSCRCLSHPGLLPCSLPNGTLLRPPCLLQGCPPGLSLCLHPAPPSQLAGLGLSIMSSGSFPCLPDKDRSPGCPPPGNLDAH